LKAAVQQAKDQELAAARDLQLKLEALRNENSSLLAKLRAEHAEEIKSLRSLLQQSSSEAAEKFQATLLEEKEKLRKEHAEDLARFTAEHQLQLNAQKSEQEARARAIQDEASRKLAEHNADWTKRFDAAIIAENVRIQSLNQQTAKEKDSAHAAELSGMSKQVQALGETVRGKDRELSHAMDIQAELRSHVQQLERQVSSLQAEVMNVRRMLEKQKDQELEGVRLHHREELERLMEEHIASTRALQTEFNKASTLMDEKFQVLDAKYVHT